MLIHWFDLKIIRTRRCLRPLCCTTRRQNQPTWPAHFIILNSRYSKTTLTGKNSALSFTGTIYLTTESHTTHSCCVRPNRGAIDFPTAIEEHPTLGRERERERILNSFTGNLFFANNSHVSWVGVGAVVQSTFQTAGLSISILSQYYWLRSATENKTDNLL